MLKLKEKSGSALLWTVLALGMLTVFATTALTMSMAYSKRNLNQNQNQQAYFTAVSAVDLVAQQFTGVLDKKSPQQQIVTQLESGKTFTITDMALPKEMGSCTVTLSMRNRDIVITAEATSGGESYCLSGIMNGEVSIIHDPNRPIYGDTGTPGVGVGSINGSYATDIGSNGLRTDPGTDIYIWDSNPFTLNTQPPFEAAHMGALYTNGKVSLSSETFPFYTHVHGEIISTDDVTLTGYSTVGLLPDELLPDELLPLDKYTCCDNTTTPEPNPDTGMVSAIESSGKVSVSDGGRVGGGITAKEISISNSRVCGDLRGETISVTDFDTWNISDYYTVKGNITGNSVTIGKNAVILGDITADTLKISGGYPKITGTIIARNIVCDFKSNVQYGITGNILAGNITLNNTSEIDGKVEADLLTMNNNSKINGDVYANKLAMNTSGGTSIAGNLSYYQGGGSGSIDSRVGGTVTRLKAPLPAITMPEPLKPITIALPPKPTQPTMPPLPPKAQPLVSGFAEAVGNVGEDSYYIIEKNKTHINTLAVTGDNNVFVYIKDNCTATVDVIFDRYDSDPNLFFILGKRSTLNLGEKGLPVKAYVWSPEGSGATLNMDAYTKLYGGIWIDHVICPENCHFHWVAPPPIEMPTPPPINPDDPSNPELEPGDEIIVKWGLAAYENR